jgi:hypothetical protein
MGGGWRDSALFPFPRATKQRSPSMAGYGKSKKSGGFVGNLSKIGGSKRKLALKSDMSMGSTVHPHLKKAAKQAHKRA